MSNAHSGWRVVVKHQPEKVLRRLPKDLLQRMREAIRRLAHNPYPSGAKKLTGYDNLYRIRVGEWRITYTVQAEKLVILVVEVSPRGDAYRNL